MTISKDHARASPQIDPTDVDSESEHDQKMQWNERCQPENRGKKNNQ